MMATECYPGRFPFPSVPLPSSWYCSHSHREGYAGGLRCLQRGEGIALVLGASGLGKTLLLRVIAEELQQSEIVVLNESKIKSVKSLYQQILLVLGQTWCGCDENEVRLFLWDYLRKNRSGVFLLLDEAQSIPFAVLDEIRSLLDYTTSDSPQIRVLLAATPKLEERLVLSRYAPICQRIVARFRLEPWQLDETSEYIERTLSKVDSPVPVEITPAACQRVHRLSGGIPRLINQICAHSFFTLFEEDANRRDAVIDEKRVITSWSVLQQIPEESVAPTASLRPALPTTHTPHSASRDELVEFGVLTDDEIADGLVDSLEMDKGGIVHRIIPDNGATCSGVDSESFSSTDILEEEPESEPNDSSDGDSVEEVKGNRSEFLNECDSILQELQATGETSIESELLRQIRELHVHLRQTSQPSVSVPVESNKHNENSARSTAAPSNDLASDANRSHLRKTENSQQFQRLFQRVYSDDSNLPKQ